MFAKRTGHGENVRNASDDQRSPIFLQFLDAIFQLMQQHPCTFEFNATFLEALMDEVMGCRYGTFLYNCEQERCQAKCTEATVSVWDGLLTDLSVDAAGSTGTAADAADAAVRARFVNQQYDARAAELEARGSCCSPFLGTGARSWFPSHRAMTVWPFHARWNVYMMHEYECARADRDAREAEIETLRADNARLREQLDALLAEEAQRVDADADAGVSGAAGDDANNEFGTSAAATTPAATTPATTAPVVST